MTDKEIESKVSYSILEKSRFQTSLHTPTVLAEIFYNFPVFPNYIQGYYMKYAF
jgi:hypothetical protein